MPLVSYVDIMYYYYYDLRVAQLNNRNDFPPCFLCRKVIACLLVHPPLPRYKSDKKRAPNRASVSLCALIRTYITCTSKLCRCARTILEAGDAATRHHAAVWLFLAQ